MHAQESPGEDRVSAAGWMNEWMSGHGVGLFSFVASVLEKFLDLLISLYTSFFSSVLYL